MKDHISSQKIKKITFFKRLSPCESTRTHAYTQYHILRFFFLVFLIVNFFFFSSILSFLFLKFSYKIKKTNIIKEIFFFCQNSLFISFKTNNNKKNCISCSILTLSLSQKNHKSNKIKLIFVGNVPGRPQGGRHGMVFGQIPVSSITVPLVPGSTYKLYHFIFSQSFLFVLS